jgi:AraC-like DNA-binding protein
MSGRLLEITNWEALAKEADYQPAKLAGICPVSLRHLERFFKAQFRTTPSRWLREFQCNLAKDLKSKGWSNKAIVAELKFGSGPHLCREFKKLFGMSPQTFAPKPGRRMAKMSRMDNNVAPRQ